MVDDNNITDAEKDTLKKIEQQTNTGYELVNRLTQSIGMFNTYLVLESAARMYRKSEWYKGMDKDKMEHVINYFSENCNTMDIQDTNNTDQVNSGASNQ